MTSLERQAATLLQVQASLARIQRELAVLQERVKKGRTVQASVRVG